MPLPVPPAPTQVQDAPWEEVPDQTARSTTPPAPPTQATQPPPPPPQAAQPAQTIANPPAPETRPTPPPAPPPVEQPQPPATPPAPQETVQSAPSMPQMPVPAQQSTAMQQAAPGGSLAAEAEDMGLEGFDLSGFGAYPIISLNQGVFGSTEGWNLGNGFYCNVLETKKKALYNNGLERKDGNYEFFYTYDGVSTLKGELVEDLLMRWRAAGWTPQEKPYRDMIMILRGGAHDGKLAALSVPKTSITRMYSYIAQFLLPQWRAGVPKEDLLTYVSLGEQFRAQGFDVTPISFTLYRGA